MCTKKSRKATKLTPETLPKMKADQLDKILDPITDEDSVTSLEGFKVGDKVKTADGEGGSIVSIRSTSSQPFIVQLAGGYSANYSTTELTKIDGKR